MTVRLPYFWMTFAAGVIVGVIALSLLAVKPSIPAGLLLLVSMTLLRQPERPAEPEPERPFVSDADEWRRVRRDFVDDLPSLAVRVVLSRRWCSSPTPSPIATRSPERPSPWSR